MKLPKKNKKTQKSVDFSDGGAYNNQPLALRRQPLTKASDTLLQKFFKKL